MGETSELDKEYDDLLQKISHKIIYANEEVSYNQRIELLDMIDGLLTIQFKRGMAYEESTSFLKTTCK